MQRSLKRKKTKFLEWNLGNWIMRGSLDYTTKQKLKHFFGRFLAKTFSFIQIVILPCFCLFMTITWIRYSARKQLVSVRET